jgi:hypothetical protein
MFNKKSDELEAILKMSHQIKELYDRLRIIEGQNNKLIREDKELRTLIKNLWSELRRQR